ncbi:MAG: molybdopterin cofactor-binding domain-containing protein [Pseudomonadota bacterium]|nr:molybdopterin cofactor-binding domain-containing protein [Pseudomonadota bacterium]
MAKEISKNFNQRFTRRKFLLATVTLIGGGLGLRWFTTDKPSLASGEDVLEPNAFLQITPTGQFIFQLDRVEMGQGTMTGLATLIAEELDLEPNRLEIRFAPVLSTFQRPLQMTGQSRSLSDSWEILRETGATARAMLLDAASQILQVDKANLSTLNGVVIDQISGKNLPYKDLVTVASKLSPPWNIELKSKKEWKWIGKEIPRLDLPIKVTGEAEYGMDVKIGGMLTAVIARCPELGASITNFDAKAALAMPGVKGIVQLSQGIAVVALDFWTANQAAKSIQLEWQIGPLREKTDQTILTKQRFLLGSKEPDYQYFHGKEFVDRRPEETELNVEYSTPYLAHAAMEPMNATVKVDELSAEVWAPTQSPDLARQAVCEVLGFSRSQVKINSTWIGGGFGRRVLADFVTEATQIARKFKQPVKLVWTREHDIQNSFYRQQTLHRMNARVDDQSKIIWWGHRQSLAGLGDRLTPPSVSTLLPEKIASESRSDIANWMGKKTIEWMGAFQAQEGAKELIYSIPDRSLEQFIYDPGMPITIWRSVGNSYNAFAVESFIDELAFAAKQDPLEYRQENLKPQPRYKNLLNRLKLESNWGKAQSGRFQGVALFYSYGTLVGEVAEISIDQSNRIDVHRVCCVLDCGIVVNPDIVQAQMESGIIFGLTAALYGEINMNAGRIQQSNFHDYRMIRMADSPSIDVHIIASDLDPTGVGEPGTPPIAPAVANAVFAATGKRLRRLPLQL